MLAAVLAEALPKTDTETKQANKVGQYNQYLSLITLFYKWGILLII